MADSYVSRRIPMFHLKNRRTFTLFTSRGELDLFSSLLVERVKGARARASEKRRARCGCG